MPPVRKEQTHFKNDWFHSEELDFNIWLKIGTDNTSFRCKICITNKDLALGQSDIGCRKKKYAEGDTHKKNMVLHKKTLNFFQPSSSKSIVIVDDDVSCSVDDDVSCSSHSNTQQDLSKPPTRPSQSIFDQGTTSLTLFKDLL